jgi:RsiW-degrading membrane proteinase PrsW (M82 family)
MIIPLILCVLPLIALIACCVLFNKNFSVLFAVFAVLAGFLPVIPIMALQLIVFPAFSGLDTRLVTRLLSALILNGLIEEAIKFLCLLLLPLSAKRKGASSNQGISLNVFATGGAIAGLTLGSLEAVMYLTVGFEQILLRLMTAALIHTLCAMLSALCIASFKTEKKHIAPFVYAVLVHGVYNFFAGFTGAFWWFSIAAILFGAIQCRVWYSKSRE